MIAVNRKRNKQQQDADIGQDVLEAFSILDADRAGLIPGDLSPSLPHCPSDFVLAVLFTLLIANQEKMLLSP
jgi:hypothetical protein